MNRRNLWYFLVLAAIAAFAVTTLSRAASSSSIPSPKQPYLVIANGPTAINLTAYNTTSGVSYEFQTNTDVTNPKSWGTWVTVLATNSVTPLPPVGRDFNEIFFRAVVLTNISNISPEALHPLYLGRLDVNTNRDQNPHLPANGQFTSKKESNRILSGWGRVMDPDGDCNFFLGKDGVVINVPGTPHDLAADINRTNAPRVIQDVEGDFTIQVRTDGRFEPGDLSTQDGRLAYNGAAIIVTRDPENVVTLARAVLQDPGKSPTYYANFEMRSYGNLTRIGLTGDCALPAEGQVFLCVQRRGYEITGAISLDGINWRSLGMKTLTSDWPTKLSTGIAAINTSQAEFSPRFSDFKITK